MYQYLSVRSGGGSVPSAPAGFVTRHPWKGAAEEPQVRICEPIRFVELRGNTGHETGQWFPTDNSLILREARQGLSWKTR